MTLRPTRDPSGRRLLRGVCLAAALAVAGACGDGGAQLVVPAGGDGDPVVDSIAVEPSTARLEEVGALQPFAATAFDASGDTVEVEVAWSSGDVGVATLTQDGVATARGPGQTDVTASVGGVSGRAVLTVALVAEP